jgi:mRNA interferase MazF
MNRGEVYDARLDPAEGSEQAGIRPVIVVSRDAINLSSSTLLGVPCTTYRLGRRVYPSQVLIRAPEGGLDVDSIAMGEQVRVLSKGRFRRRRGAVSAPTLAQLERALLVAMDLPGQHSRLL